MKTEKQSETMKLHSKWPEATYGDLAWYQEGWRDCIESLHVAFFSNKGLFKDFDFADMYAVGKLLEEKKQGVFKRD